MSCAGTVVRGELDSRQVDLIRPRLSNCSNELSVESLWCFSPLSLNLGLIAQWRKIELNGLKNCYCLLEMNSEVWFRESDDLS